MIKTCHVFAAILILTSVSVAWAQTPNLIQVEARVLTSPVNYDADDPALWVHPDNPAQSLVIGTDKGTHPTGGLFVWNLDGTLQQRVNISHPNNIDVRYGLKLAGRSIDIAVVTMRDHRSIRVFAIDPISRTLSDVTTTDRIKIFLAPYGITLYKRKSDGAIFAIVSSENNETKKELWQILLEDDGTGRVKGTVVRKFGDHQSSVEGIVVDDKLGYLYAAEDTAGIHKYYADPAKGDQRLAFFATDDGITGNREGLALYSCSDSTGYLLVSIPGDRSIKVYPREGAKDSPHRHELLATIQNANALFGDGLDVTSRSTSAEFERGLLVWHHEAGRQFGLYAWEDIARDELKICSPGDVTSVDLGQSNQPSNIPKEFALKQNHPNPFSVNGTFGNPETEIRFDLPVNGPVQLIVYTLKGEEVNMLVNENMPAGRHVVRWDAKDKNGQRAASGVYLYKLKANGFSATRKMTLIK